MEWPQILQALYEANERSWSGVARALQVSDTAVLAYRDGRAIPRFTMVDRIAAVLTMDRVAVQDALVRARIAHDARRPVGRSIMRLRKPLAMRRQFANGVRVPTRKVG